MKAETGKRVQQVAGYVFVILVTGILLYRLLGLSGLDIVRYPINYSSGGDSWTGMATVKSMADNGWIYNNAFLGAPDGAKYYDATTMELVLNAMEQVLVWITGNWVLAFNLFYFSGYFLAGVTAYYAFYMHLHHITWQGLPVICFWECTSWFQSWYSSCFR